MEVLTQKASSSFCTFHVGDRLFGADILDIKEINTELSFTRIHHASEHVEGYVNIRGQIHLILNLSSILGHQKSGENKQSKLVLFKEHVGPSFGILVDKVGDIIEVEHENIEDRRRQSPSEDHHRERRAPDLGSGICKLDDELLIILQTDQLLKHLHHPTLD